MSDAQLIVERAAVAGVRIGCAPDTVLGTGVQTARKFIDDGQIGTPIAATATMITPGHENWHPNPDFYYQPGGGPLLDMGPYYVTALVTMLGPVVSTFGVGSRPRSTRAIARGPRAGELVAVNVDTHVTGVLTHASGALSTLVMSFDGVATRASSIEIHGGHASLIVPDPNTFSGDVQVAPLGDREWRTVPTTAGYRGAARGCGVADLAVTAPGLPPRASASLALHVLDVLTSLLQSAVCQASVAVRSSCERPTPVPLSDVPGARSA